MTTIDKGSEKRTTNRRDQKTDKPTPEAGPGFFQPLKQKAKQQRLHQQEVDMARDEKKKEKATGKRASPKAGTSGAGAPGGGTGSKLHIVASTRKRVSTF
eukprot:CAMPEP_0178983808 /NCGR_PEP_ID=MMETSP0795-20121207/1264_1 /TAXON_ID=88552 /ORGANISM="Amoebophrya sp., Strain Ameob2" /LENGTH=99 /DNA_ID=CAMNT_0020674619 /DNA_START=407 /DNA_END=707 /DNA_ORIENTATION=+